MRMLAAGLLAAAATLLLACAAPPTPGPLHTELPAEGARLPTRWWQGVFFVFAELPGIAGQQLMLLDTGTDRTLLDLQTVRALGLDSVGAESVVTATGATVAGQRLERLPTLRLGAARFSAVDAVGLDLSALREHGNLPIVGIVGCDLFRHCLLELDYPGRTVRVLPRTATPPGDALLFTERTPWVTIELAGQQLRALVDSGFQHGLALPPGSALPWRQSPRDDGDIAAIDGTADKQIARVRGPLRIGPLEWRDPWVVLVPGSPKLGAGVLRRCRLVLDASGGRLWLQRQR